MHRTGGAKTFGNSADRNGPESAIRSGPRLLGFQTLPPSPGICVFNNLQHRVFSSRNCSIGVRFQRRDDRTPATEENVRLPTM